MAATLQPSEYDILREVEALRDIRRRSVTPGALTIDLDLPNQSSPTSPTSYRLTTPSDESSSESASGSGTSGSSEGDPQSPHNPANDTFPLFQSLWVPASVHPEIAPAEFRAFLKEHARLSPSSEDGSGSLGRSGSFSSLSSSSGLGRKKSMLSRQYRPDEDDGVENENIVPLRRNRSSFYHNQGPQLTFDDLQKLEQLAEEASVTNDPSRLRDVLRRSLSLNVPPLALGKVDELPNLDEADAPIIVPPPGQILRRAARTKIRKAGPGESVGHRFGGSRRKPTRAQTALVESRSSDDISSSDHGDSVESGPTERRSMPFSDEGIAQRRESFSEEAPILDLYLREGDESETSVIISTSPPTTQIDFPEEPQPTSEIQPELLEALGPVIHHPQPQRLLSPQPPAEQQPSRTPSPPEPSSPVSSINIERPPPSQSPPAVILTPVPYPATTSPPPARKEKDKKSLFGKWGGEKGSKKLKQKDSENKERAAEKEKEKDSGFFGSLFGTKRKQEEVPPPLISPGQSGRETAQALLGAPKSKSPAAPGLSSGIGPNNYSRYPIHVERAIYRLSHIKLANPRRPLYEQVLISNLMFWYLGVINKTQNPQPTPTVQAQAAPSTGSAETHTDDDDAERERREREQQELRERAERERQEKERVEREMEMKKKESGRKGSLTKPPPGGARRAEMPVRGPQYEMQHREMQQEYNGYNGQSQQGGLSMYRSTSAPVNNANSEPQYQRNPQQYNSPKMMQPQATHPGDIFYYSVENLPQQSRLPPGAMSPDQQMWHKQQSPAQRRSSPPPSSSPARPGSPPARNHGRYNPNSSQENIALQNETEHRTPVRSVSATAAPTQPMPNGKVRKVNSASAAIPGDRRDPNTDTGTNGEEEDIPLAMWQQQRRR
ncbi:hypothetical protein C0992_004417 [Termitomyces sp. T32_za158]|nr:hypothetical protein C0992_004417 [Termitomyces sp. T32_za158]